MNRRWPVLALANAGDVAVTAGGRVRWGRTVRDVLFDAKLRPTPGQYRRIVQVALFALAAIIVTGAAVRLTGSGLGCSDWPLCEEGEPFAALEFHPMVEFVNRLITGLVSISVIIAVLGSLRRTPRRTDLTRLSLVLVAGVIAQIIIGAFVTISELKYSVVAAHFLVSMVLVWAAVLLLDRAGDEHLDRLSKSGEALKRPRWTSESKAMAALATGVLITGSTVTSAGAHAGSTTDANGVEHALERLPLDVSSVARIHSILVWLLCLITIYVTVKTKQRRGAPSQTATELLVAVVAQGALGYVQYFNGVPALLVGFHVAGSIVVWVLTLRLGFALAREAGREANPGAGDPTVNITNNIGTRPL